MVEIVKHICGSKIRLGVIDGFSFTSPLMGGGSVVGGFALSGLGFAWFFEFTC